ALRGDMKRRAVLLRQINLFDRIQRLERDRLVLRSTANELRRRWFNGDLKLADIQLDDTPETRAWAADQNEQRLRGIAFQRFGRIDESTLRKVRRMSASREVP